jgi:Ca2+-binding EF-hand superfamily protein
MQHLTCALLLGALLPGPSLPAQDGKQLLTEQFQRLDADKDGALQRPEFPGSDRQFAAMDKDKDGKATLAEYLASDTAARFLRANYQNQKEPRPRQGLDALALRRFEQLSRCDPNKDGKVTRAEWRGSDEAFLQLDLDDSGAIDGKDRAEAMAAAPAATPPLPDFRGALPSAADLLLRLDKDKDDKLSKKEASANKPLEGAFAIADRNQDGCLDDQELQALLAAIERLRADDSRAQGKPIPYDVPFDAWDKDKDGKVRQNEWQGPRSLFERMDLDRDAAVSRDEVARYRKRVTGDDFVQRFDLDGDGKVTLAEFGGPADAFRRADKNGDGVISRSDR